MQLQIHFITALRRPHLQAQFLILYFPRATIDNFHQPTRIPPLIKSTHTHATLLHSFARLHHGTPHQSIGKKQKTKETPNPTPKNPQSGTNTRLTNTHESIPRFDATARAKNAAGKSGGRRKEKKRRHSREGPEVVLDLTMDLLHLRAHLQLARSSTFRVLQILDSMSNEDAH